MVDGLVTIVIPIYNVEKYLDRCMESITGQTYKKLEIIMVDDGSCDACPEKCEDWARRDKRVKVIHKKNAGLGMARNTGIEIASGEYICFFDSDDYIAVDTIEKSVMAAKKREVDIVVFGFSRVNMRGEVVKKIVPITEKAIFKNNDVQDVFLPDLIAQGEHGRVVKNLWMSAWSCMYSMKLIAYKKWKFVSEREIISEDIYSLMELYKDVKSVCIIREALYFYCDNAASLTHIYRDDRFDRINYFYEKCKLLSHSLNYSVTVTKMLAYPYIANVIAAMKMVVRCDMKAEKKIKIIRNIVFDTNMQKAILDIDFRYETKRRAILLSVIKFKWVMLVYILTKMKG